MFEGNKFYINTIFSDFKLLVGIEIVGELVCSFRFIEIPNLLRWFAVTFASAGCTAIVIVSGFSLPGSYS